MRGEGIWAYSTRLKNEGPARSRVSLLSLIISGYGGPLARDAVGGVVEAVDDEVEVVDDRGRESVYSGDGG